MIKIREIEDGQLAAEGFVEVPADSVPQRTDVRPRREFADFYLVEPQHHSIHDRLENWARWCRGRAGSDSAPMFRLYRSSDARREYGAPTPASAGIDPNDAQRVASAVASLPLLNRGAVQWAYLRPGRSPSKTARELGVKVSALAGLLEEAREILRQRLEPVDETHPGATIRVNC